MNFHDFIKAVIRWDVHVLASINHLSLPAFLSTLIFHSNFLGLPYLWVLIPLVHVKNPKKKWNIIFYYMSFTAVLLLNVNLKYLILRPRPDFTTLRVLPQTSPSFPSGHSSTAWAGAASYNAFFKNKHETRTHKTLKTSLYLTATIVSFARMYVGVHYFTDVTFGAIEAYITARVFLYYYLSTTQPKPNKQQYLHSIEIKTKHAIQHHLETIHQSLKNKHHNLQKHSLTYQTITTTINQTWTTIKTKQVNTIRTPQTSFLIMYTTLLTLITIMFITGFIILHEQTSIQNLIQTFITFGEYEDNEITELSQNFFLLSLFLTITGPLLATLETTQAYKNLPTEK